ncbi:MAG TPA: hypothetical protein PLU85_09910 [Bacteroidia bacterium]|nr:hypothetical protein [Bacteroidia bacterium]QQR95866.1 MAG: hypothetical protein IPJ93_03945 [Bacteroidota bacterium]MBP7714737.1 hypothetical protein [Bacteroidia bacterium]MBP8669153.1 hypothetical protein [Bacteroidia bacterium]HOZ82126.1 hypothetical protein [Bacteroidia bacterium]
MKTVLALLLIFSLTSCRKEEKYPIEPVLLYKSVQFYEKNSFYLTTTFTDGDGDIGLSDADTLPPYDQTSHFYHNYFCNYQQLINGSWTPINFSIPYYYRIPMLTPKQRNKNIKGDIQVDVKNFLSFTTNGIADTFRVEISVADRALHESNKVLSDAFVIYK